MKIHFSKKFDYYTSIIGELNIDVNVKITLRPNPIVYKWAQKNTCRHCLQV